MQLISAKIEVVKSQLISHKGVVLGFLLVLIQ